VAKGEKEEKGSGGEIASNALMVLVARIGDIFGIFDLSFFVSGAVCLGAVAFGVYVFGGSAFLERVVGSEWKAVHVGAAVVASYVLGMVCFAAGAVRRRWQDPSEDLAAQLETFQLDVVYGRFLPRADASPEVKQRAYDLLYTRLWAELRQSKELAPSFNLITRYWVMAAMCDGLSVAWLVWAALWMSWLGWSPPPHPWMIVGVALAFCGAAVLCAKEAARYGTYQVYELVATLAYAHAEIEVVATKAPPPAIVATPAPVAPLGSSGSPPVT
jgi:hypothetical protein